MLRVLSKLCGLCITYTALVHCSYLIILSISCYVQLAEITREAGAARDQLEQLKVGHLNQCHTVWWDSRQWQL